MTKHFSKNNYFLLYSVITVVAAIILTAGFVLAWNEPAAPPTYINVPPPINTSINAQAKQGALVVGVNSGVATGLIVQYGNVGIGTTGPDMAYKLDVAGDVRAIAFYYDSDISLKENIAPIKNSLGKILSIEGVYFNWKDSGDDAVGLIAQEVEKIFPQVVSTDKQGIKSVEYSKLIAPLIEAIKEQQGQIDELRAEIELLKYNK